MNETQTAEQRLAEAAKHPHKGPDDTDASMLRKAAKRAATGYVVGGSNTAATVARVLRSVADILDEQRRDVPAGSGAQGAVEAAREASDAALAAATDGRAPSLYLGGGTPGSWSSDLSEEDAR